MGLELVEVPGPEAFVLVDPLLRQAKRLAAERDEDFPPATVALDQPRALQELQVLGDGVERQVERLRDVRETCGAFRKLPDDGAPAGVGDGDEDVVQLLHGFITPKGVMNVKPGSFTAPGCSRP